MYYLKDPEEEWNFSECIQLIWMAAEHHIYFEPIPSSLDSVMVPPKKDSNDPWKAQSVLRLAEKLLFLHKLRKAIVVLLQEQNIPLNFSDTVVVNEAIYYM